MAADDLYVSVFSPGPDRPMFPYKAVIVYGGADRLTPVGTLEDLPADRVSRLVDTATGNFIQSPNSNSIEGSLSIGDLNGDGASDILLGARTVLLGTPGERPALRAIDELDGRNGFRFGTGITTATLQGLDVDGDTFDDLVFAGRNVLPGRQIDGNNPEPPPPGVDAPTGFRVLVYSAGALELFWDRVPATALRYEVSRDGETVGTTDGTSLYLGATDARRAATYEVVAIAPDGRRSVASSVEVGTGGTGDGPAAPSGVRVSAYSASALEVFWARASVPGLRYEIRRGDTVVGSNGGRGRVGSKTRPLPSHPVRRFDRGAQWAVRRHRQRFASSERPGKSLPARIDGVACRASGLVGPERR